MPVPKVKKTDWAKEIKVINDNKVEVTVETRNGKRVIYEVKRRPAFRGNGSK
jgi:hypothetical protein